MTTVRMSHYPLHNRSELDIPATNILKEMIEFKRIISIEIVDHCKGIPVHAITVQEFYSFHHLGK